MLVNLKESEFCDIEVENSAILYNDAMRIPEIQRSNAPPATMLSFRAP
jgi:hypothetical protein